ncbi:MAG: FkbM family methyltransferase [Deltaproteobacteria bacterium]|nr:FkbM family methyltransferase [Deltaproteobacteria bacterium]MCL5892384.1 FkbM family methyltransferase [Deltaproteobacteria bacterium]
MSHTLDLVNEASERVENFLKGIIVKLEFEEGVYHGKLSSVELVNQIFRNYSQFDYIYNILENEESKKEFDWFIKFRVAYAFLSENIALDFFPPRITEDYYRNIQKNAEDIGNSIYEVENFRIRTALDGVVDMFYIEQYRIPNLVEPKGKDIVIDAGAYYGETAFWFLKYIGSDGKVYAFEPSDSNFRSLKENVENNKVKNIEPIKMGLGRQEEGTFLFNAESSSYLVDANLINTSKIRITTIDKFVEEHKLKSVGFIKMDIEGSEIDALAGAKETITRYKPKLAISVYHKGDDMIKIPMYLKSIVPDYKFFLRHNKYSWAETVLYTVV